MLYQGYDLHWSKRHTFIALAFGASASAAYTAYRLYRYHGYFSRAGVRRVTDGDASFGIKRAVDEYLQFHYGTVQETLPYTHAPKVIIASAIASSSPHPLATFSSLHSFVGGLAIFGPACAPV